MPLLTFPAKYIATKSIFIRGKSSRLLLTDKQDDNTCSTGGKDSTGKGLKSFIPPKFSKLLTSPNRTNGYLF